MNKRTCELVKEVVTKTFERSGYDKKILSKVEIIDKYAKGLWFWRMKITVTKDYKHLLDHIYHTACSIGALGGEYLDKPLIKGRSLYLS